MHRLSDLCIALSAAALLTAGLTGQAQSQEGGLLQGRLSDIASYHGKGTGPASGEGGQTTGFESAEGAANFDLFRGSKDGKYARSMLLSVTITPKGKDAGKAITFPDIEVGPNGSYEKALEDGTRISGKVSSFLRTAFSSDWSGKGISATYTGPDGSKVKYTTDEGHGRKVSVTYKDDAEQEVSVTYTYEPLSDMMFFDSWKYSMADETSAYFGGEGAREIRDGWRKEHLDRGGEISKKAESDSFFVSLRLQADVLDTEGRPTAKSPGTINNRIVCTGMRCTVGVEELQNVNVLAPDHFRPIDNKDTDGNNKNDVLVVLKHQDIHLTIDKSKNNAVASPLSFGAWMKHAGFFVAPGGFIDVGGKKHAARMVAAAGQRTDSRPGKDATWRGSMVGTVWRGEHKDHILRGDAELKFDMSKSSLDVRFFNIRNYDRFGEEYNVRGIEGERKNQILFTGVPVKGDGRYKAKRETAVGDGHGSIQGAFYGDDHGETAGTFRRSHVLGAFGAKKVQKAVAPEN